MIELSDNDDCFLAGLQLTVQWIVIAVLFAVSIISTPLICSLLFWLFVRKYSKRQQQTPQQVNNSTTSTSIGQNCDEQHDEEHKIKHDDHKEHSVRKSKHIYSIPRWSSDSEFNMTDNEAYQSPFSISINAAYSSVVQDRISV